MSGLPNRKLRVLMADRAVGTLVETPQHELFFEYSPQWLLEGFSISPFHLPLTPGLKQEESGIFEGLFGVFDDSLPDGWGLLLMDRFFRAKGIAPESLSPLERLSYVGNGGIGALEYRPVREDAVAKPETMDLDQVGAQAERIFAGSPEEALPALRAGGGSSNGSRPKVFVAYNPATNEMSSDVLRPGPGFEHWLVKFRAENDPADASSIEEAYAAMAKASGVEMPATRLFPTKIGQFFGIQRFDRGSHGERVHTHTLGGLVHSSFRHPNRDYQEFLAVVLNLTRDSRQVEQAFRRAVFNVLAHNRDDHVKNHAFLADAAGRWTLSPAFDVTLSDGVADQHNLTVMGKGKPGLSDLYALAKDAGISKSQAKETIDAISVAVGRWAEFAELAGVSKASAQRVASVIGG